MTEPFYSLDFCIEESEDGCFTRVIRSAAGEARHPFMSPFAPRELAEMARRLSEEGARSNSLAKHVGETLFRAAFQGEVLECLEQSWHIAYEAGASLRLRLHLRQASPFDSLPWETLYDASRQEFLGLSPHTPMVRYVEQMHQILPLRVNPPLRMLVVIASPGGYPRIDVEREWLTLLDRLDHLAVEGKLVVERLLRPTLLDLQRRLREREYALVHFIGHGVVLEQTSESFLVFEDEVGRSRFVSDLHLGSLMRDHYSLRLVTLDARGTRRAPGYAQRAIAHEVVRRGIPAAIAMPPELSPAAALAFAEGCTTALADLRPVDEAVVAGRRMMVEEDPSEAWCLPEIVMRVPDGYLFDDGTLAAASAERNRAPLLSRTSSLHIRTASRDTIASWREEVLKPKQSDKGTLS